MKQKKLEPIDIAMAGLAIITLSLLFLSIVLELTPEQESLFEWVDHGVSTLFIIELGFRFRDAPSKRLWFRDSWADILGSIPTVGIEMSIIRGFRLFKVAKAAKAAKTLKLLRKTPKLRKKVEKFL